MAKSRSFIDKLAVTIQTGKNRIPLERHDTYELQAIAKYLGLRGYSRLKKTELIERIRSDVKYQKSSHPKSVKRIKLPEVIEEVKSLDDYGYGYEDEDDEEEDILEYTTIEERIKENAFGKPNTDADWYASELYLQLELVDAEQRLPSIGEFCFFSYSAAYPDRYKYYDQRPLTYILEYQEDKILGANVHYLNPSYRDSVATSLLNKGGTAYVPKKTLHSYFISNMDNLFIIPDRELEGIARLVTERFVDRDGVKVELQMVWDS